MKPDSATALTFPERIGRYHLLDLLGEGGFARVFRAELQGPSGFRKQVALKLIKDVRPAEVQHLLHEGRVGGLLKHRNVVDTYELGVDGETVYLAMELVEGLSLREMCVRGGVPPSVVMEVIHGICRGVAYAHTLNETEGVVHLDLKPENVLIGWDGSVKVSDFGLAQWVGVQQKVLSSSRGSLGYMSPEQRDGGSITVCSDVFSLGLVIYELVSGASFWPLEESETQELASVEALLGDGSRMAAMDAFAEGLGDLVRRCLEVNSQDRPISAQELVKPVRRLRRQVDDDPPLEEWLAASMNQREVEDLRKRTPSSGSIYGKTFDFAQQEEGLEARLERVLQAFGQCTDQR